MTPSFRLIARGSGEDGHRFEVAIPAASALFTGHFPGHPILPGIVHLALAQRALGEIMGREVDLAAVRSLKLRRPISPGDTAEIRVGAPGAEGTARFEVRCGSGVASQGVIEIREPAPVPSADLDAGETLSGSFPPPEALLPHRPPALLLNAVTEILEGGIVALAEVSSSHPLVSDGRFPSFLGLEAAAQAAAALEALGRREGPGLRIGYLVGIRDARLSVPSMPAGRRFRVAARLTGGAFPLSLYAVTVGETGETGEAGHELVTGTLSTFLLADS
jgi:predicted hotdog family 3-hydroxylacyl-ACP dehydratase